MTRINLFPGLSVTDQGRRQRIVKQLRKYLDIDTFGACGDKTLPCQDFQCPEYLSSYRFYLAFENSVCKDYISEKFWHALERGQIPVVYGGADYMSVVPRNSYIDVRDFDSTEHLAQYIKKVNASQELFNSYMWWKRFYRIQITPDPWCDLCQALHDTERPAQVYSDLDGWYKNDSCPQFSISDAVSRFVEGMLLKYNIIS